MDKQIKVEEKLTKEERDILERNLEIFFAAIVKSPDIKGFDIEDIENKESFLEKFSPWHQEKGQELIQKFVDIVNNDQSTEDFSWLDILDEDKQWKKLDEETKNEVKNKSKHVNMRYQIPTHFHGDIDNAVLFYCMENPRGYLGDYKDSVIDKEFQGETLNEFYVYSADKRLEESKRLKEIVRERYQLNDVTTDLIKKIIYSDAKDETPLRCELDNMFDEKPNFFSSRVYTQKK